MKKVAGIYVNPEDVSAIDFRVTEGSDGNEYAHPVLVMRSGAQLICPANDYLEAAEKMLEGVVKELLVVN